ncbi:Uncharacterised protein [Mycobacterium tuberculosis]|nr:Uncharacterised protein [Mycobacterium tuberculosis]
MLIRPTRPLPPRYRVEMTLRGIGFGGRRHGTFDYNGRHNGYTRGPCKTRYPWTFTGALPGKTRCQYPDVTRENGFYYLTILDYATPAPHGNPGIHYRRKVIMDGYYSDDARWKNAGTCNPKTGEIYRTFDGTFNGINALFVRGDKFREAANNNISNEYYIKTVHVGQATLRVHHDFVEDGRPIWHYNQTPGEYDGRFDRRPHLNYYEGEAYVDDIRLYVPKPAG